MGAGGPRRRLFLSFYPRDTARLATRLSAELEHRAFQVWCEPTRTAERSRELIRASDVVVALLSPGSTSSQTASNGAVLCLEEIAFARRSDPPRPIVPVMAIACRMPVMLLRSHYIDMLGWDGSDTVYADGVDRLVSAISILTGHTGLERGS